MSKFSIRSHQKELLDRGDIPFEAIKQNMKELDFINTWLGGHRVTLKGMEAILRISNYRLSNKLIVCELGCGGGDNLRVIGKWCKQRDISVILIGIDVNPNCTAYARSRKDNYDIDFITADYRDVQLQTKPDVIFSSLFCHHFSDEELASQFNWMKEHASVGFFANDLQRHALAYYSIQLLTQLFSKSYLVKNDAPLSVLRGFHKKELYSILYRANIHSFSLQWKWAFRWLLVFKH